MEITTILIPVLCVWCPELDSNQQPLPLRTVPLPIGLPGHRLVPSSRIELLSPGYQPGALPLSYEGVFHLSNDSASRTFVP